MNTSSKNKGKVEVKVVKRGRPVGRVVNWKAVSGLDWINKTNREIAEKAGCSVVAVFLRRKKMISAGKNAACRKERYTRAKFLKAA